MSKWQRFRDSTPSAFELGLWSKAPGANIGVLMGTVARKDLHVVSLDFDAKDADDLDTLLGAAPVWDKTAHRAHAPSVLLVQPVRAAA